MTVDERPRTGARVPGWSVRLGTVAIGTGMAFWTLAGFWLWCTLGLLVLGAMVPRIPAVWGAIIVLAGSTIWHTPSWTDWRIYALIASVHLLHVLASYALVVPARSSVAFGAFAASAQRFLAIQVGSQAAAVLALLAFARGASREGTAAGGGDVLAIVAAAALIAVLLVLLLSLPPATRLRR